MFDKKETPSMKIVLAPDSFKGSLSSSEVTQVMERPLKMSTQLIPSFPNRWLMAAKVRLRPC